MNRAILRAIPLVLMGATACSFLLDINVDQCFTDQDCAARGGDFVGKVCRDSACVRPSRAGEDSGPPQDSAASDAPASSGDAAVDAGPPCVSTPKCVADNKGEPYVCKTPGQPCLPLKTLGTNAGICPEVYGKEFLSSSTDPIIVGAFLNVDEVGQVEETNVTARSVMLAVDEISTKGIFLEAQSSPRPLVVVVCRNNPTVLEQNPDKAFEHLVDKVGVHAIIAELPGPDLIHLASKAVARHTLVLNVGFANDELTLVNKDKLLWHMLGNVTDITPAYNELLARVEKYLSPPNDAGLRQPIRVAMFATSLSNERAIADKLIATGSFNGNSFGDNERDNLFMRRDVKAWDPAGGNVYDTQRDDVLRFKPNVILGIGRDELVRKLIPDIENQLGSDAGARVPPFYILPPSMLGRADLLDLDIRSRMAGVGLGTPPEADAVARAYFSRFRAKFGGTTDPYAENYYDPAYMLAYAYVAAAHDADAGADAGVLGVGMERIVVGSAPINVGPLSLIDGYKALWDGGAAKFMGAMGPADFNSATGTRSGIYTAYCVNSQGAFVPKALAFDNTTKKFVGDFATNCFPGL